MKRISKEHGFDIINWSCTDESINGYKYCFNAYDPTYPVFPSVVIELSISSAIGIIHNRANNKWELRCIKL